MNKFILGTLLLGSCCLAMPQGQSAGGAPKDNPFVKILELESYQNGADFGHALQQEDGTATGQKVGPDGLIYGFYSYIQDDGKRIKVYYRAGQGVGYEVLKVEGLDEKSLGNLKPTISKNPQPQVETRSQPRAKQPTQTIQRTVQPQPRHQFQPQPQPQAQPRPQFQAQPQPKQPVVVRQPVLPVVQQPVLPQINPLVPQEPTPAPHRFDYPANLNLQRTGTGFRSSFKAL